MTVKVSKEKEWQVIVVLTSSSKMEEIAKFYECCHPYTSLVSTVTVRPHVKKQEKE